MVSCRSSLNPIHWYLPESFDHWSPGESCGLRSSKSQDVRPATARAASPAQPRQVSPRPAPRRTGQSLTAPAGRPAAVTPTPPAPAARGVRERSLGSSQRNLARPQTAMAARPQSARRTQTPTVRPQSVRRSDGDTLGRSQSRVSPRHQRVELQWRVEIGGYSYGWVCCLLCVVYVN